MKSANTFARSLSQQMGLFIDDLSPTSLFGCYGGYHIILCKQGSSHMGVYFSARRKAEMAEENDLHELLEQEPLIHNMDIRNYRLGFQLRIRYGARTQVGTLIKIVDGIVHHLQHYGYENCCEHCGAGRDIKAFMLHGSPRILCEQCYWELEDKEFGINGTLFESQSKDGPLRRVYARLIAFLQRREHRKMNYKMRSADMEWERRTGSGSLDDETTP